MPAAFVNYKSSVPYVFKVYRYYIRGNYHRYLFMSIYNMSVTI